MGCCVSASKKGEEESKNEDEKIRETIYRKQDISDKRRLKEHLKLADPVSFREWSRQHKERFRQDKLNGLIPQDQESSEDLLSCDDETFYARLEKEKANKLASENEAKEKAEREKQEAIDKARAEAIREAKAAEELVIKEAKEWEKSTFGYDENVSKDELIGEKYIQSTGCFSNLSDGEVVDVVNAMEIKKFEKGDVVVTQGEQDDSIFIIIGGTASVKKTPPNEDYQLLLATLRKGEYFGEAGFLKWLPRSATVSAESDTLIVLTITREYYDALGFKLPVISHRRRAVGGAGVRYKDSSLFRFLAGSDGDRSTEKSPEEFELVCHAIRKNKGLRATHKLHDSISDSMVNKLAEAAWRVPVLPGKEVIVEGDLDCEHYFVVNKGKFKISVAPHKSGEKNIHSRSREVVVKEGDSFGELALLYHFPRAATVVCIAEEEAELFAINRVDFRFLVEGAAKHQLREFELLLEQYCSFGKLLDHEHRMAIVDAFILTRYHKGTEIVRTGELPDCVFCILEGSFTIINGDLRNVDGQPTIIETSRETLSANKNEPKFLCEDSVISNVAMNQTILAESECMAYVLRTTTLQLLLGTNDLSILKGDDRITVNRNPKKSVFQDCDAHHARQTKPDWNDLKEIGLLGCGGFGTVTLVKDTSKNKCYALKQMSKGYIVDAGLEECVVLEKNILLLMVDCQFINHLYTTYKDDKSIYFLLEPATGGELFYTMHKERLHGSMKHVKFFVACVIEAIDALHLKHVVYRDLKPENVIIDSRGYGILTDMGLAKVISGKTYTVCGTPAYFAPELLSGKGHSFSVDWWCLGCFIYELVCSHSPFEEEDIEQIYRNIAHGTQDFSIEKKWPAKIRYRSSIEGVDDQASGAVASEECKAAWDFFLSLCEKLPEDRLPMRKGGMENLLFHSLFMPEEKNNSRLEQFDWEGLEGGTIEAPYLPKIKDPDDISNFHCDKSALPPEVPYVDPKTNWEKDF